MSHRRDRYSGGKSSPRRRQVQSSLNTAVRFQRLGLAALIASPASAPIWQAQLVGARRPRWSPHDDPRVRALAAGYSWLLGAEAEQLVGLKESEVQ
ncbi:MAG: hypothetical protein M3069_00300 [Chloroflexota bacterium]|nr:hypothetical protein [Chloroflexota bacterium]